MVDKSEEGLVEGSAVEASTGIRFHFKGHYLVIGKTGHFAVSTRDSDGGRSHGLTGTLRLDGTDAHDEILATIEDMIRAGTRTGHP